MFSGPLTRRRCSVHVKRSYAGQLRRFDGFPLHEDDHNRCALSRNGNAVLESLVVGREESERLRFGNLFKKVHLSKPQNASLILESL